MALLVVAALFWGNCYSCPQMLLAGNHSCCHHGKSSKTSECTTQGLRSFVKAEKDSAVPALPVAAVQPPAPEWLEPAEPESAPLPVLSSPSHTAQLRI